jgi:hypothetical protein
VDKNLGNFLLSLVVLIPFLTGLVRLRVISRLYRPFILLLTAAVLAEVANYITINLIRNNSATINIYSLVESLLIISQFYYWRYYSRTRRWYPYFGALCVLIWVGENLFFGNLTQEVGPVFRISAAFILVVLSVNEINYLLINDSRNLLKNARFLICTGFLIYFLYQILLEGSIYVIQQEKNTTARQIIKFSLYINLVVNIIYGIAVWFIPKRISLTFRDNVMN